jgi:probable F420-dependent oxidoreductase
MSSRFGVLLEQRYPWKSLVEHAQAVESAGFDSLWIADHFANPFAQTDWLEAWTTLAALAVVTTRIRLGTLVTNIVYRHPALVAKQAATVDQISQGRLELGMGAGIAPTCHRMTGTPFWSGKERQERFAEFIAAVDQLLREERSSYSGRYWSGDDVLMCPAPLQRPRPPLTVAAHGPRSRRLAARYADTWSLVDPQPGARLIGEDATNAVRNLNRDIDEKAQAAGRDPRTIARSLCCGYVASSAWRNIDEALSGIEQFERAGMNEFVFRYVPHVASTEAEGSTMRDSMDVEFPALLPDETALRELAAAIGR